MKKLLSESLPVFTVQNLNIYYGNYRAVQDVSMVIPKNKITAFIGPSGCGKSTILHCFNRLNDLIDNFRLQGKVYYYDQDLYAPNIDVTAVRKNIGMVFQKPNPFPKIIFDNVAYGARVNNYKGNLEQLVEDSLRQAALWDEVKDKLQESGFSLSGGQQQRLCIARAITMRPEVLLMDEPCSALDPISTLKVEELMDKLKENYTIIVVTHNMQQATRVADYTAFYNMDVKENGNKVGYLVEFDQTNKIFNDPQEQETKKYVSGYFG